MSQTSSTNREDDFFVLKLTRSQIKTSSMFLAVLATVLLIGGAFSMNGGEDDQQAMPAPDDLIRVQTRVAEEQEGYARQIAFVGAIEAAQRSRIGFERAGKVIELLADEGESISQGECLARLDTQLLASRNEELGARRDQARALLRELENGSRQEDIDAARAEVERARAELEIAELTARRFEKLVDSHDITRQQWDSARLERDAARARLRAAETQLQKLIAGPRSEQIDAQRALVASLNAQIETLNVEIEKSALYAPYDALIVSRLFDEGVVVDAGAPLFELAETGRLEARIGVTTAISRRFEPGDETRLGIDGDTVSARVKHLILDRERQTRTVDLILEINGEARSVVLGDLAELRVSEEVNQPVIQVPLSALKEDVRGLWSCYVVTDIEGETGVVTPRGVETLHSNETHAYVRGSLSPGERFIAEGLHRVTPGQRVRVGR